MGPCSGGGKNLKGNNSPDNGCGGSGGKNKNLNLMLSDNQDNAKKQASMNSKKRKEQLVAGCGYAERLWTMRSGSPESKFLVARQAHGN